MKPQTTFDDALVRAREAVDDALAALDSLAAPDSDYVEPMLRAQDVLKIAARERGRQAERGRETEP